MGTFKFIKNTVTNWYIPLIVGLIFIATGVYTFVQPLASYAALSWVFAFSFLISGFSEVFFALSSRRQLEGWGWTLVFGLVNVFVGFLLLSNTALSMEVLPLYVGFTILFRSISGVSMSLELKDHGVSDWGTLMLWSVLGILFAFMMIFNPIFGGLNIVIWTGLAFLISGIYSVMLAFKLKKLKDYAEKIPADLKAKWEQLQSEIKSKITGK
ncbi:HdeD family acid-resistance protein [Riemerella columbina]|uniref:HdeD family acid-resistance protein n=1 Tax=Riemerella columbina TaxID=103810 RepID=UPI00266F4322|nr:DUF308 domain-containing protein [Riemerella columbina]WKS96021.1 DUF308 domain-containing protein [Riemerella columbina]